MDRDAYEFRDVAAQDVPVGERRTGHGIVPIDPPPSRRSRDHVYLDEISYRPMAEVEALAVIFADD